MADTAISPPAAVRFRTFGELGPMYEILGAGTINGTFAIRVFDTGEELDYRIDRSFEDPEA